MAESDREDGLDPFGQPLSAPASGASDSDVVAPEAMPAPAPEPASAPRRSPLPWLFAIAAIAATAVVLWRADHAALDSAPVVTRELDGHALAARSLVSPDNVRRALDELRAEMQPGEQLISLRLAPAGLSATVRDPNANTRLVEVAIDFGVKARDWSKDRVSTPIDLAAIDPAVPARIARAALRATGADDTHLAYLALTGRGPSWTIGLDDVPIADQTWVADLDGIAVTHPGELPFAEGLSGRSLLRERTFAAALKALAGEGRRVSALRAAPDRINATVHGSGGARDVQVDAAQRVVAGDARDRGDPTQIAIARIDPAALQRAFATVVARAGTSPGHIDYAVLGFSRAPQRIGWALFLKGVPRARAAWRADGDGRHVERLG